MDRIQDPTAVTTNPGVPTLSGPKGFFTPGDPGVQGPTDFPAWYINMIQEEIYNVIIAGGLTPNAENFSQLLAALEELFTTTGWVEEFFVPITTFDAYIDQPVLSTSAPTLANLLITGLGTLYGGILDQALLTSSSPEFANVNIPGLGNLYGGILDQAVLIDSSPTFEEVITNQLSSSYGSVAEGGYWHFTGNIIVQFGPVTVPGGGPYNVDYPIAFPNNGVVIVGSYEANPPPATGALGFQPNTATVYAVGNSAVGPNGAMFIAIGY